MKLKGIRISPQPPPKSLRQNPGRLLTGGPVFPVPGRRRARSARTRGWTHRTEEKGNGSGHTHNYCQQLPGMHFSSTSQQGQYRKGADCPELAAVPAEPRAPRAVPPQWPGTATSPAPDAVPGCSVASSLVLEHGLNGRVGDSYTRLNLGRKTHGF